MSGSAGCELAHLDAAYVLGALAPEERLVFERHLLSCPACSRSVQQLAGLPGLLAQVPVDVLESEPVEDPLPDTLLPALVREVRRSEHRRRWVVGAAAAAAVVVVGAGSVVVAHAVDGGEQPSAAPSAPASTAPAEDMRQVGQHEVVASVALTSVAWGTRLDLTCSYGSEPRYAEEAPSTYVLVVRSSSGDTQQVATWRALPGRTMRLTGATALAADDIASVEVQAPDGRPVLELDG